MKYKHFVTIENTKGANWKGWKEENICILSREIHRKPISSKSLDILKRIQYFRK